MTDYKAMADRLVERGIGRKIGDGASFWKFTYGTPSPETICTAEYFCHDWRVAGACMERMKRESVEAWCKFCGRMMHMVHDNSLPLAIILAYLEATDGA